MAFFGQSRHRNPNDPFGLEQYQGMQNPQAAPPPAAPDRRWAEGGKFGLRDGIGLALAGIGDAFQNANGGRGTGMDRIFGQLSDNRARKLAEDQYQRRRADELTDWTAQKQWERDNPKPIVNDTVNDYQFISQTLGGEAAKRYLQNKTLPPPFVQRNDDGTSTIYPQGLPRGGEAGGPQPGMIRNGYQFKGGNPNDKASWEPVAAQNGNTAVPGGQGGPDTYNGKGAPSISQAEAAQVLASMGGDRNQFSQWMRQHQITIRP
jgi:hypothetical protein